MPSKFIKKHRMMYAIWSVEGIAKVSRVLRQTTLAKRTWDTSSTAALGLTVAQGTAGFLEIATIPL